MNKISKFFLLSFSIGILFTVAVSSFYIWKAELAEKKKREKKASLDAYYLDRLWHAELGVERGREWPSDSPDEAKIERSMNYFQGKIEKLEKYMLEDEYSRDEIHKIGAQAYEDAQTFMAKRRIERKSKK